MSDVSFNIQPVDEKPRRKNRVARKGGKYEPIISAFLDSGQTLVRVESTDVDANYLASQLNKIKERKALDTITVSVRNKEVYLEKT